MVTCIFFGSTPDSLLVLTKLATVPDIKLVAVVTQPPRPVGRKQIVTETPVATWAKTQGISVLSFPTKPDKPWRYAEESAVVDALEPFKADLLVSASYGQKIPTPTLQVATYGGLNVHPSVLPRWRGGDPVPWAILSGDREIGVSVVTLAETFDKGKIIAQKKIPITPHDTSDPLRTKLFVLGAGLLVQTLPDYISGKNKGVPQHTEGEPYAKRFSREDGFEPWENIQKALTDQEEASRIDRKFRALTPWPGLWSMYKEKRIKILEFMHAPTLVQLEGKKPVTWEQFQEAYGHVS